MGNKTSNGSQPEKLTPQPIELGFQIRLITKVGILLGLGALLPAGIFWWLTSDQASETYTQALQDLHAFQALLFRVTALSAAGQSAFVGLLMAAVALLASHRIAGPLVRFGRSVRQLGEGDLAQTVGFRRGDQDKSLPAAFHALCERLRQRLVTVRRVTGELGELRERLTARGAEDVPEEEGAERTARNLRELAEALRAVAMPGGKPRDV